MFSTRRLAKRSIVGTRICAPWTDERFYPAVIQSTQTWPNGEDVYTILFDDGYTKVCKDSEIIGPGFQSISIAKLKRGQKVFLTHNGREVSGNVISHDPEKDEVFVDIADSKLVRKLDDVRLMESRKSARLQDQDTDYSRMADIHLHSETPKKRTVSSVIDVPAPKQQRCHRHSTASSPDDRHEEDMLCDVDEANFVGQGAESGAKRGVMDTHMAAMVLTSLSCSPVSPGAYINHNEKVAMGNSPGGTSSSVGSSGVWGLKSESGTPSPPQFLMSTSAPMAPVFGSQEAPDEGVDLDDSQAYFSEDLTPKKKKVPTATLR